MGDDVGGGSGEGWGRVCVGRGCGGGCGGRDGKFAVGAISLIFSDLQESLSIWVIFCWGS